MSRRPREGIGDELNGLEVIPLGPDVELVRDATDHAHGADTGRGEVEEGVPGAIQFVQELSGQGCFSHAGGAEDDEVVGIPCQRQFDIAQSLDVVGIWEGVR